MFSRLRNYAHSALGRLSSASPSVPETAAEDTIDSLEPTVTTDSMVTTRGGRETDSPVVAKAGASSAKRQQSTNKRRLEEEIASPAAAVKRRRNSRGSGATKQTEEEVFREIVEENSQVDVETPGAHTTMELRDTPAKAITEEDVFHKIEEQATREVSGTEDVQLTRRRTTAVVEVSPKKKSPKKPSRKEDTKAVTTVETTETLEQAHDDVEDAAAKLLDEFAPSQPDLPKSKRPANKTGKGVRKTSMPLRSKKIDAAHLVPFEDEETPAASNQPSNASEIIEISDGSDADESVDESAFLTNGAVDSEAEDEDEDNQGVEAEVSDEVQHFGGNADVNDSNDESQDDSDDEAPEAVTTSTAQKEVEQAQAAAAEAIEKQTTAAKLKRQARDRALKERAQKNLKSSKASSSKQAVFSELSQDEPEDDVDETQNDDIPVEDMDLDIELHKDGVTAMPTSTSIPDLLPASLLATTRASSLSPVPVVAPHLSRAQQTRARHLKFIEEGSKRTKDVRRGPVSVRVLEQTNVLMAPAAEKSSRNLREKWLQGRDETKEVRGKHKPNTSARRMARKPVGSGRGFLRN